MNPPRKSLAAILSAWMLGYSHGLHTAATTPPDTFDAEEAEAFRKGLSFARPPAGGTPSRAGCFVDLQGVAGHVI